MNFVGPKNFVTLPNSEKIKFLDSFDTVLTDCDGVLWNTDGMIGDAANVIKDWVNEKKRVYYVTNNSTKTKQQFIDKCKQYGFPVGEDNICSTAILAAEYLKNQLSPNQLVYVVGSKALEEELKNVGLSCFGIEKEELRGNILESLDASIVDVSKPVGAVLVGFDEYIDYIKMMKATTYLSNPSCKFVCTDKDETCPSNGPYVLPGTGAIVASIEKASGRESFVIGKPSKYLKDYLNCNFHIKPEKTLFIGDRINTDILMGNKCNFTTLLVLSGIHQLSDVRALQSSGKSDAINSIPHYYTNSISDLVRPSNDFV